GLLGMDAYSLLSRYSDGKKHYNKSKTNMSLVAETTDFRHPEGDYAPPLSYYRWNPMYEREFYGELAWEKPAGKQNFKFETFNNTDKMLVNGARFYVDMGHPEYSTPECSNPVDLVTCDKAGEYLLNTIRKQAESSKDSPITILKNNSDKNGHSYGCHENYLLKRISEYDFKNKLVPALLAFLVTRQVYTGAGKLGTEKPEEYLYEGWFNSQLVWDTLKHVRQFLKPRQNNATYQLSQRADFIQSVIGLQTTYNRPIINTRDESHSNQNKYFRLHVICGDANMSEISNYLKTGTAALVLDAIEDGLISPYELENPVKAFKEISKKLPNKSLVKVKRNTLISPLVIQRDYLDACKEYKGRDEITDDILNRWEYVLDKLETEPMALKHWLDWVAKKYLIETYADKNKIEPSDPILHTLDLRYHDINPNNGLYHQLLKSGFMERLVTDNDISYAVTNPPSDTRAKVRGNYLKNGNVIECDWSEVKLLENGLTKTIKLPDPILQPKKNNSELFNYSKSTTKGGDNIETIQEIYP
ncbi:MAG: proteasome accessory factor PafA2 family protein, partial [Planctomycetota bacterium]|nr:proteasome accessory factor PafA2 family protein [Planctomycetota bacterium]